MKDHIRKYFESFPVTYVHSSCLDLDYIAFQTASLFNYVYDPNLKQSIKYSFKPQTYVVKQDVKLSSSNNRYIVVTNTKRQHYVNLDSLIEPPANLKSYNFTPFEIKRLQYTVSLKYKKILQDIKNLYNLYKYETNISKYYGYALSLFIEP